MMIKKTKMMKKPFTKQITIQNFKKLVRKEILRQLKNMQIRRMSKLINKIRRNELLLCMHHVKAIQTLYVCLLPKEHAKFIQLKIENNRIKLNQEQLIKIWHLLHYNGPVSRVIYKLSDYYYKKDSQFMMSILWEIIAFIQLQLLEFIK